jgi:RNA polymerase sigma factor (sigma-70 family)
MGPTDWPEGAVQVVPHTTEGEVAAREVAFRQFTQSRLERAYRLAAIVLRHPDEAEDVVHDAALQAWLHWHELRDPDRLDAWFDRIVVNGCRARMRLRRVRSLDLAVPDPAIEPDVFTELYRRDVLHRALTTLDADHRIVVVLRYVMELTPAEIAARTGAREGTVKSRLHYALRQMRAALDAAERTSGGLR